MSLDLSSLQKAIASLDNAIQLAVNNQDEDLTDVLRDAVIKRYEYTYEISWKMLQRWIKLNVSPDEAEPLTKKDLFRQAAKKQLISAPEPWFDFNAARNESAHTYNLVNAQHVYTIAQNFCQKQNVLYQALEARND